MVSTTTGGAITGAAVAVAGIKIRPCGKNPCTVSVPLSATSLARSARAVGRSSVMNAARSPGVPRRIVTPCGAVIRPIPSRRNASNTATPDGSTPNNKTARPGARPNTCNRLSTDRAVGPMLNNVGAVASAVRYHVRPPSVTNRPDRATISRPLPGFAAMNPVSAVPMLSARPLGSAVTVNPSAVSPSAAPVTSAAPGNRPSPS